MPRLLKFFSVFCFSAVSICLTLVACYWVAERYYFDKFFYQKSQLHGYWIADDSSYKQLAVYGKRADDMLALLQYIHEQKDSRRVLGATATNEFTIVLFGDSYVWGVGVLEQQRFASLIEKELNAYRPTNVVVFAVEGDNLVDHWRKYKAYLSSGNHADLFLFGIVDNDAFLKSSSWYGNEGQEKLDECEGEVIWDVSEDWTKIDVFAEYPRRVEQSLMPHTKNWCVVQKLLPEFPKKSALYISLDSLLTSNPNSLRMTNVYKELNFPVLTLEMPGVDLSPVQEKMFVSQKERHPSVLAHQLYAKEIVKTLLSDPRFGFVERVQQ